MPSTDQGVTRDRYMLIPRTLIFLERGEDVLLLKGAPTKRLWANKYNGIGGHVERGESLVHAAGRELLEETGLSADLNLRGTLIVDTGEAVGICVYVFTGEYVGGEIQPSREGTAEWVNAKRLDELPCVEDVPILINHIRAMDASHPPFSARSFYEHDQLKVVFD